jgi:LIVCS family branched-chain amino acid:cation transporter
MTNNKKSIFVAGFAIFTMFFGAGNMAFPLLLAKLWGSEWLMAFFGFVISGVFVTLLGLFAGVLTRTTHNFFLPLGFKIGFLVQMILICIEGPFGIVPRCFMVAFGGIKPILDFIPSIYFYIFLSLILFFLATSKTRLVSVIGKYLTPLLLSLLAIIFVVTLYKNRDVSLDISFSSHGKEAFMDGLFKGYLTYDLPGAIYFTTIAMTYLQRLGQNKKEIISNGLKACSISAVLLIVVYIIFFYLGISYREVVLNTPAEQILPTIVNHAFGNWVAVVFAFFILLACLTTAVAAITIWTDFIYHYLERFNIKYNTILACSLVMAIVISTVEFSGLMSFLGPILNVVYPLLIFLSIYNILTHIKDINIQSKKKNS